MDEGDPSDDADEPDREGSGAGAVEADTRAGDGEGGGDADASTGGDESTAASADDVRGTPDDGADPDAEVEDAVREVMGPDALDGAETFDDEVDGEASGESDADVDDAGERDAGDGDAPDASAGDGTGGSAEEATDDGGSEADGADAEDRQVRVGEPRSADDVPEDVRKYDRFKKIDGGTYDRANEFLRDRTYITAREWAIARLCADFRTETGVEMTKIGENLPELVPFMTDTYTPQAVNQARAAFEEKVRKAGATFLYGAMCDFFTAEELDDVMYESTEVAKFLLEVEGVELSVDEELAAEDHISEVMRDVREHSAALRHDECPHCGNTLDGSD